MVDTERPGAIVAVTGEHGRFAPVRSRAAALAAGGGASVILYDLDAASLLESPMPTNWSAAGSDEQIPDRLSPDDLELAGRASIAQQVRGLRQIGVDAWGWLPTEGGGDALAAYAREQDAQVILVPPELESPGFLDRLRGRTLETTREESTVPVVVVRGAGNTPGRP